MANARKKINKITYKVLVDFFDYNPNAAVRRISAIRASLGKQKKQTLTIFDYCKAEDISIEDFDKLVLRSKEHLKTLV